MKRSRPGACREIRLDGPAPAPEHAPGFACKHGAFFRARNRERERERVGSHFSGRLLALGCVASIVAVTMLDAAHATAATVTDSATASPSSAPGLMPGNAPQPAVDINADTPPPSSYDLVRQKADGTLPEEGRSLAGQALRTVFALLLVVALIYAFGKLVLARMGRIRPSRGATMRITERVQLDARNALVVVEIDGRRLLVGSGGDKGLSLLTELGAANGAAARTTDRTGASRFNETLARGASEPSESDGRS